MLIRCNSITKISTQGPLILEELVARTNLQLYKISIQTALKDKTMVRDQKIILDPQQIKMLEK
jgi:hypothetical protein